MRALATLALLVAPLLGQQASYSFFGQGCPQGEPPFRVIGVPRLGGTFAVETNGSCRGLCLDGGVEYWVLTGVSNTRMGTLPLPFDTSVFTGQYGAYFTRFCGFLRTSMDSVIWTPAASQGPVQVVFTVPNNPGLLGMSFYQQVLGYTWSSWVWQAGFALSRGGHGVIGT